MTRLGKGKSMILRKAALTLAMGTLLGASTVVPRREPSAFQPIAPAPVAFDGTLSLLTYNIEGLPWPVARGRPAALTQIVAQLRRMRAAGNAPHVIVLQEAFVPEAQAIGAAAGYRYRATGPAAEAVATDTMTPADRQFAAGAHWWKGETAGKFVGSGLEVLSDFPIVATRRMAFPNFACAGYDCLANKGAVMVSIAVPGLATPIDVATTHLNSRHAAGVSPARANEAYVRQVGYLNAFIAAAHDPRRPLIVAGDFNVGKEIARRAALLNTAPLRWGATGGLRDALRTARRDNLPLNADARFSLKRARDWQFFASGRDAGIALAGITVPFGHDADGDMLSDHVGYVARFRFAPVAARPDAVVADATRTARPKA